MSCNSDKARNRTTSLVLQARVINMSSFEEAFGGTPTETAELEASLRERHPEVFEGEPEPPVEELAPDDFRYDDDGTQHRRLTERERATLNEGHLSAHGREAAMARVAAELDRHHATGNEELPEARAAPGNNNRARKELENPITVNAMRDGVVDEEVYSRYVNEIIHFVGWAANKKEDWLTDHCKSLYTATNVVLVEGEKPRARQKRIKAVWLAAVRKASSEELIKMDKLTPEGVMEFISCQAHQKTGKSLSQAGYNGKRSAVQHLVRCQMGQFWSGEFDQRMKVLWKGFSRLTSNEVNKQRKRRRTRARASTEGGRNEPAAAAIGNENDSSDSETEDEGEDDDDRNLFQEGKSPMTPELYQALCKWFMEWGNIEGVFAACFLSLTWHLACRSNNTGKIKTSHMQWTYFDALHIWFRHTKTQKHGEARRHKRACYSNPYRPEIDLPFLLGLYLATAFNTKQKRGSRLFPGGHKSQSARMGNLLKKVLHEHKAEVLAMGYDSIDEIGVHSVRKGVSTYLASMPGGPPAAALCLRGGWSMGQVKDIYFHQTDGGDEFVGRCAALLNMANGEFATSPAIFEDIDKETLDMATAEVFPHFCEMEGMERILARCLASLQYHRKYVLTFPADHVARSISLYRQNVLSNKLEPFTKVYRSWETSETLTGIPPHIKSLVDIGTIKEQQGLIVDKVYNKVMDGLKAYFEDRAIGGGQLTEARIRAMIQDSLTDQFQGLKNDLSMRFPSTPSQQRGTNANSTIAIAASDLDEQEKAAAQEMEQYPLRVRDGLLTRLPNDFEFPKAGVYDLWLKWNIGDTEQGVPPLRLMTAPDFSFLDKKPPLRDQTFKRKNQLGPAKRRPSRKIFSDIKFVCNYISARAGDAGMDTTDRSSINVRLMYEKVEEVLYKTVKTKRGTQLKWRTLLLKLRSITKQSKGGNG